jgi:predicted RNase H-like nuclease (RuvC/YqgF family)
MTGQEHLGIEALGRRVDSLDADVKNLRTEFESYRKASENADRDMASAMSRMDTKLDRHVAIEDQQYREQDIKITGIQTAIATLSEELKEPLEIYKTTKYGAKAATTVVTVFRFLVPLGVAVLLGYNAWQAKMLNDLKAELPKEVATMKQQGEDR